MKRFYKSVELRASTQNPDYDFEIFLDSKPLLTPKKRKFVVHKKQIANLVAREWMGQADFIDLQSMPITKLHNSAIDIVRDSRDCILDDIIKYLGSDLLFYRAESPEKLAEQQKNVWDPIVSTSEKELGHQFIITKGIKHVKQPTVLLKLMREILSSMSDTSLAAIHLITTLSGSAVLAFLISKGMVSQDKAWSAAHLDEDWQNSQWGTDPEAYARRLSQENDFKAASIVLQS